MSRVCVILLKSYNRLEALLSDPHCSFVLYVGKKRLIKRKLFDQFIEKTTYL